MRLKFVVVTLFTGMLSSFAPAAVCPLPTEPEIPDGSIASGAEMLRAKKALETYRAEVAKYLECDSTPIKKKRAETQAAAITTKFDEQMERYKAKS